MCNRKFVEIGMGILLIIFIVAFNYGGCIDVADDSSGSSTSLETSAPSVTTLPAGDITLDSVTLNGLVNPNGADTSASFQWGTSTGYGTLTPSQSIGNGNSNLNVVASLSGLTFGTTYYFRLRASNSKGITYSSGLSFNTLLPATAPLQVASPNPVDGTTGLSILNVQLFWLPAAYAVSYDVYFGTTTPTPTYKANVTVTNYIPDTIAYNTRYYWRIDSKNSVGITTGNVWSFTTQSPQAPVVETSAASYVLTGTATLNGKVNPMALTTTAYFQYKIASSSTWSTITPQPQPIGSGLGLVEVWADISGLLPATTYNFNLTATNAPFGGGTATGVQQSFTTDAVPPTMITNVITTSSIANIFYDAVTLTGTANPNGSPTTIYFQYGITPSNNSFPAVPFGGQSIGSGQSALPISTTVTGLSANNIASQPYNIYNFRAVGSNSSGQTAFGSTQTFTTRNRPLSPPNTLPSSSASGSIRYAYRFYPTVNGQITALGRYSVTTGNATLNLWNDSAAPALATVTVSTATGWQWANLTTPYSVTAGTFYRVSVDCTNGTVCVAPTGSFTYLPSGLSRGNIIITAGDYYNSPIAGWPSTLLASPPGTTTTMYGWADIEFLPNQ